MNFQWAEGFRPPKGVSPDDVAASLAKLEEPSPESLYEASKEKGHILHGDLWSEGDQVWARRGRIERCRKIISSVHEIVVVGGRDIAIRNVEFVRSEGKGRWAGMETIRNDPKLWDAYMAEVLRLQDQAAAKLSKLRELMSDQK